VTHQILVNAEQITTHVADAIDRLPDQFRRIIAPTNNITDLITKLTEKVQELENIIFDMAGHLSLADATGETLERYGELVGQSRPISGLAATDDNVYRGLIYGQIVENTSNGTIEQAIAILLSMLCSDIIITEIPHAAAEIQYTGTPLFTVSEIREILIRATAPIELDVSFYTATPFGFAGDPTAFGFGIGEIGSTS